MNEVGLEYMYGQEGTTEKESLSRLHLLPVLLRVALQSVPFTSEGKRQERQEAEGS
jgi:hypothetical protein